MSGQQKPRRVAPGWPSFPPKPTLPGLLDGLKVSQWWSAAELAQAQQPQLGWLVSWAATQVPYYAGADWAPPAARALREALVREPARFPELWRRLPLLTKPDLRALGSKLNARTVPPDQAPLGILLPDSRTSAALRHRQTS